MRIWGSAVPRAKKNQNRQLLHQRGGAGKAPWAADPIVESDPPVPAADTKLQSTYVAGAAERPSAADGRIHSVLQADRDQNGTVYPPRSQICRISPSARSLARNMRKFFVSEPRAERLLDADYSQIELRILAHLCERRKHAGGVPERRGHPRLHGGAGVRGAPRRR